MKIKFAHCRNKNYDGSINPHGGLCLAYVINDEFKVIGYAAARCHPKDAYVKQVGRMKAAGRLKSAEFYQDVPEMDEDVFIQSSHDGYKEKFNG